MNKKFKFALIALLPLAVIAGVWGAIMWFEPAILNPQGVIAQKQQNLIITASLLMLIIVVPVFALTFGIAWRYRASNTKAKYTPDWDHNNLAEITWWTVPSVIILILSVIIWQSSHALDPYKPLQSDVKPITVQVVALEWKWLFIYPEQKIASVNYLRIPEGTPINFEITADAPMNSFWVPQLGGQVYAMAGMTTKLHLMADHSGVYQGSSANLSGAGFAGMKFVVDSTSGDSFDQWVTQAQTAAPLTSAEYDKLVRPSENNPSASYTLAQPKLYDDIVMKYMMPAAHHQEVK